MSLNGVVGGVELAGLKKDYTDFGYSDIGGVKLEKGIARSTIKLTLKRGEEPLELGKLPNSVAEKGYGIIRENVGRFQAPFTPEHGKTSNAPKDPE